MTTCPKPATASTMEANHAVLDLLPFDDRRSFDDARRGFIATLDPMVITDDTGRVVWDLERFLFLGGAAPETVNPSLWRMSQLNVEHGLFRVVDRIHQVRGFDISNMTVVEGDTGYIVIDPLKSAECAAAAMQLVRKHLGDMKITAVIYTHSHADHFGGVKGIVTTEEVRTGSVRVIAPTGFMEHTVSENVYAGTAMNRRAEYMYGNALPADIAGMISTGLGTALSEGVVTLVEPTELITESGQELTVDGVRIEFQYTPDSEAPAEMHFYFPELRALCLAENVSHHMHNLYTPRGAQVRDAAAWSNYFILFSVSALVVGYLADRFTTKSVLVTLALIWALAVLPIIGPAGFGVLLASRIVLGAAEGPAFGVAQHALQKWFIDTERSIPTALLTLGTSLGVIVAAPGLTWVIIHHGWRSAFVVLAVMGLVWCAIWMAVGREGPVGSQVAQQQPGLIRPLDQVRVPVWRILTSRTWLGCALSAFAGYWSVALMVAWLPQFLTDGLGYGKSETGTLTALPWAVGGLTLLLQGYATQRLMKRGVSSRVARGVLGGAIVIASGVCTLGFVYAPEGPLKIVLIVLGLGMSGTIVAIATTVCGEIAPTGQRGVVLGAFVAVYSLAGVIAPYFAGSDRRPS